MLVWGNDAIAAPDVGRLIGEDVGSGAVHWDNQPGRRVRVQATGGEGAYRRATT